MKSAFRNQFFDIVIFSFGLIAVLSPPHKYVHIPNLNKIVHSFDLYSTAQEKKTAHFLAEGLQNEYLCENLKN